MRRRGGVAVILALAGCAQGGHEPAQQGARLEVEWTGADTGKLSGPAVAEWCGPLHQLQIRALQGDSGIALALYSTDTVRPDSYPVLPPERADSMPPAAAVALRLFQETAVKGFRGDSGRVILDRPVGGRFSGRFRVALQSATDGSRLRASGRFRGVTPVPSARECLPRPPRQPRDTGVPPDTGIH